MASSSDTLPAGISSLCRRTDRLLWEAYERSDCRSTKADSCRLLFPRYRKDEDCTKAKLRVSEQEARFAFVEALCKGGKFRYSVETPTDKLYQFTGDTRKISAQTDLTVYDKEGNRCNVEFKEGGITLSSKNQDSIYKDVLKLMREPVEWGLWFHLLESANSTNICHLLEVIREQIRKVREGECKDDGSVPRQLDRNWACTSESLER